MKVFQFESEIEKTIAVCCVLKVVIETEITEHFETREEKWIEEHGR